jgi:hypothetical protein
MFQIAGLQDFIVGALNFVITPAILLVILVWAVVIVARAPKGPVRTSAAAGLGAGIVLFVIYVSLKIDSLDVLKVAGLSDDRVLTIQLAGLGAGVMYGALLILLVRFLSGTRLTGALVLFLTMSSLAAIYSYFFGGNASYRTLVQFLSLGTAFGIFLHILIFPASVRRAP